MTPVRALVVDDDEDDVWLVSSMLSGVESVEFEVASARSLAEVELRLQAGQDDVYLVDFRLGADNGFDVAQAILARFPHAPVILLTGMHDHAVDVGAAEVGIVDYLVKGKLDGATLERSIRYAVRHQRALRRLAESEERYSLAIAGANDGVWDFDLVTGRIYLSARWKALLGYPESWEPEGPAWSMIDLVHPEDAPSAREQFHAHLRGESPHFETESRMLRNDGTWLWTLVRGLAVRDEDGTPTRIAGSLTDVHARKGTEHRLQHDALHDALTGLPNRVLFLDRLEHAMQRDERRVGTAPAVLFLDLDRFKLVNDSLGHAVGDGLLVEVATRLRRVLRPADTVARLGGDEFTILLEDLADPRQAEHVARRVLEALRAPYVADGRELYLSASIGIALAAPGASPTEVIRDADAAMYRAKAEGKGRHALFDHKLHEAAVARLDLETRLRRGLALEAGPDALHVAYQPIVHAGNGKLRGFEALARWTELDGSTIPPDEFIPVAEETGLINQLGRHVLREACSQLRIWREDGAPQGLTMAVNISGRQLLEPGFPEEVEAALADFDVRPDELRLEITETAASSDYQAVQAALEDVYRRTGVRAHLDDFGTGTSSLTFLRGFPGDALKIDRSFVLAMSTDEGAYQIVKAICGLAHDLGIDVVAEGVETDWQLAMLRELGCEYAQGYLLARPLAPEAAEGLLARGRVVAG